MNISVCFTALFLLSISSSAQGAFSVRCFDCRSRGELGSCKDPFLFTNVTTIEVAHGVSTVPCTSGWCRKSVEKGTNSFKDEEYGAATERACLLRGPQDGEERCAYTTKNHEKVFMCFCQGDLCNGSPISHRVNIFTPVSFAIATLALAYYRL